MTMTMHKAEKINPTVCCQAERVIAIAQATNITRIKTACLPDQRNILCTFSKHEKFEHVLPQNYTPNVELPSRTR
jgi:hypothetical protein